MAEEVYMDIPQVQRMAQSFGTFGEVLQQVGKALEAAIWVLRITAFVGDVGDFAIAQWLSDYKPIVDGLAQKMLELRGDIESAINNYQTGDITGSTHFLPGQ